MALNIKNECGEIAKRLMAKLDYFIAGAAAAPGQPLAEQDGRLIPANLYTATSVVYDRNSMTFHEGRPVQVSDRFIRCMANEPVERGDLLEVQAGLATVLIRGAAHRIGPIIQPPPGSLHPT
jgi:hypothetical protein